MDYSPEDGYIVKWVTILNDKSQVNSLVMLAAGVKAEDYSKEVFNGEKVTLVLLDSDGKEELFRTTAKYEKPTLTINEHKLVNDFGYGRIIGTVTNYGSKTIKSATIAAKIYDKNGVVLGTHYDFISDLAPGETAKFEIYTGEDYNNIGKYEVYIED